jgi:hypothetical protein
MAAATAGGAKFCSFIAVHRSAGSRPSPPDFALAAATTPIWILAGEFVYYSRSIRVEKGNSVRSRVLVSVFFSFLLASCAPQVVEMAPTEAPPGATVSVFMKYLVGWPRVEIADKMMDWPQLKLSARDATRRDVAGEELVWIEDKVLRFKVPDLPPGEYNVTIHDDKGPPGDLTYSVLETTAYVIFPPVWPFVFRSNQARFKLRVLPPQQP